MFVYLIYAINLIEIFKMLILSIINTKKLILLIWWNFLCSMYVINALSYGKINQ